MTANPAAAAAVKQAASPDGAGRGQRPDLDGRGRRGGTLSGAARHNEKQPPPGLLVAQTSLKRLRTRYKAPQPAAWARERSNPGVSERVDARLGAANVLRVPQTKRDVDQARA